MKLMLMLALAVLFICPAANADYPYVGLYAGVIDPETGVEGWGGYDHSQISVQVPTPYSDIEMWIWFLPDPQKGLASVTFKIVYPTSTYVIQGGVTSNPLNQVELGTLSSGMTAAVGYLRCQYDWYWSHHQTLTLKKVTPSGIVSIVPDPGLAIPPWGVIAEICELALYRRYACTVLSDLYLNWYPYAVEDKTWGAIKSLYAK